VIATARSANHEFLHSMGADVSIDYTTVDFTTAAGTADVVLDLVGGDYGKRSLGVLGAAGRYVTTLDSDARADPRYRPVTGRPSPADLGAIGELAGTGRLHVHLDHVASLTDVIDAHRHSESGRTRGKLALTPWS
jgi:NADPH:quinone reductase-like Zn-dependent oxidoreductase